MIAAVVMALHRDRVAQALDDRRRAAVGARAVAGDAVERENSSVHRERLDAGLSLITSVADVDRAHVRDVERLRPVQT